MKLPYHFIIILIAAGLGLGLAGALLRIAPADQADGRACVSGPACGTPYRVVNYTVEEAKAQTHAAGTGEQRITFRPAAEPIKPLLPVTPVAEQEPLLEALAQSYPEAGSQETAAAGLKAPAGGRLGEQVQAAAAPAVALREEQPANLPAEAAVVAAPENNVPVAEAEPVPAADNRPAPACPAASAAKFELIPIEGGAADHPDTLHGDLSLALRGYSAVAESPALVDYNGLADPDAPQLAALFGGLPVQIGAVYRANHWIWDASACGQAHGCAGPAIEDWPVTVAGIAAKAGAAVYAPSRGAEIYSGGYVALVLYAEPTRLTLGYTRRDSVAAGYVVHLENLCVDPNLLALYRAQVDGAGWRASQSLPAVRNRQVIGTALGQEVRVAIRDAGNFLDPRSRKDWWQGQ